MNDGSSRREFLTASGAVVATMLAGCSGNGGGNGSDTAEGGTMADERPVIGEESAPVTLTVFSDFSCPHCKIFKEQTMPQLVDQYVDPGDARYLHGDFPIPVHEQWSYAVAGAARAVYVEAGNEAFWTFATNIYDYQRNYSLDVIETVADEVAGIGTAARTAAEDGTYREWLETERDRGLERGVGGTPAVFVDDELVTPNEIDDAIQTRL